MDDLPTILETLDLHGETLGDCPAYTFLADGEQVTAQIAYRDLPQAARAVAGRIQDRARPGERALLLYPPGPEFVLAFLGCLYAGVVAVPTYPPAGEKQLRRLRAIVEDADAAVVLTTGALAPALEAAAAQASVGNFACMPTDTDGVAGADAWRGIPAGPDTLAMLQYTSGSTGSPKGVMLTHGNLTHNCLTLRAATAHDHPVFVTWLPQFHDMGLIANILQALFAGVHAVTMPPEAFLREPVRWLRAISTYGATWSGGPNFAYDLCVRRTDHESREGLDLSSWRVAFNGAEPIRAGTLRRFAEVFAPYGFRWGALYPGYGLAESTVYVTASRVDAGPVVQWLDPAALGAGQAREVPQDAPGARPIVHCGWPSPDTELRIVDPDTRREQATGAIGEVWLRGASVGLGYWANAAATEETFRARLDGDPDGAHWLRTGDLGYVDETGGLYVTGRLKDVLILQGLNHYPQDLELTAEEAHPLLRRGCGAAFAVEADGEERVVLVFEVREDDLDDEQVSQVVTAVSGALLEVHGLSPAALALVRKGTVHKTTSGKIARAACRRAFLEGGLDVVGVWVSPAVRLPAVGVARAGPTPWHPAAGTGAASDPGQSAARAAALEQALVEAMASRLGVPPDRINAEATFAESGMDSAGLVELAAVASRTAGRYVRPAHFFDHPTPAAAACALVEAPSEPARPAEGRPEPEPARRAEGRPEPEPRRPLEGEVLARAVAVVGIGCRFPTAGGPDALWTLLQEGRDCIGPPPTERRALGTRGGVGGFLTDVGGFDAECFGIAPREAQWVDPQQRLLLEVTWEALEDAHLVPSRLAGRPVGVFVGISNSDYGRLAAAHPANAYAGTGTALSVAANRLSYFFDFQGPSVAVDTACSASLVAVHQAVTSLRVGESEVAVAGGVNLVLAPYVTAVFDAANMLSSAGRCRTFDDRADGYVRGEGCGVVVLKRLEDALAAGDPIRAVIRGSAVNTDGHSNGLTAPNGQAQRRVIRGALRDARVDPSDVRYVETHGTGTPLGDPIEFEALADVFGGTPGGSPVYLGSVKTNLGHTESAAGIAGLLKAVLAVERGWLPPHLHLERPNRHIDLEASPLEIVTEGRPWPEGGDRVAGVSSFGFGGANAHVVVAAAPVPARDASTPAEAPLAEAPPEGTCHLLPLAAHSQAALGGLAGRYAEHLAASTADLADLCWSARTGREQREHRLAVTGTTREEVRARLSEFAEAGGSGGRPARAGPARGVGVAAGRAGRDVPPVAFVFPGQGSEFPGMASALAAWSPVFRRELEGCLQALDAGQRSPVQALLYGTARTDADAVRTSVTQPALFAFEYALARLWQSWGVAPVCVAGHSLGEYVAAALAGVFSPADGIRLVAARGALIDGIAEAGAMAVIAAGPDEVEELLEPHAGRVGVAAINGPRQVVVAGEADAVRACVGEAASRGLAARLQSERYAFHSHLVEPVVESYRAQVALVALQRPRIDLVAGTTGAVASDEVATPGYWAGQLRKPVRFADAAAALAERGCRYVVEVGPAPVLTPLVRRSTAGNAGAAEVQCLPSMRAGQAPDRTLLEALGRLWVAGAVSDLAGVEIGPPREAHRVTLPAYPFQRRHYWLPEAARPTVAAPAVPRRAHPLLGTRGAEGNGNGARSADGQVWTRRLRPGDVALVDDHRIEGRAVLPGVAYLELALAAVRELLSSEHWELTDVEYSSMLVLGDGRELRVRLAGDGDARDFTVESRPADDGAAPWTLHARGRVSPTVVRGA